MADKTPSYNFLAHNDHHAINICILEDWTSNDGWNAINWSDSICHRGKVLHNVSGNPEKFCVAKCDARRLVNHGVVSLSCT